MPDTEAILLLSGGIDSTVVLAQLRQADVAVHALSFDYGQRHKVELEYAAHNARKYGVLHHHVITLDLQGLAPYSALLLNGHEPLTYINASLPKQPTADYVPGRNLMMLSHAAAYAEARGISGIYIAANKDDAQCFPDCHEVFLKSLQSLWHSIPNTRVLELHAPLLHLSKAGVVQLAMELGVDLEMTLSCYHPVEKKACGQCHSCISRRAAIHACLEGKIK